MKPDIDPENADLFGGRENGSLHIYLARDLERWHVAGDTVEMRIDFHPEDWHALFVGVLHVETLGPTGWLTQESRELDTDFPMLGRIWSVYDECVFLPDDVSTLRGECVKLAPETAQPEAVRALRKLLYACDEATKRGFGLILTGD